MRIFWPEIQGFRKKEQNGLVVFALALASHNDQIITDNLQTVNSLALFGPREPQNGYLHYQPNIDILEITIRYCFYTLNIVYRTCERVKGKFKLKKMSSCNYYMSRKSCSINYDESAPTSECASRYPELLTMNNDFQRRFVSTRTTFVSVESARERGPITSVSVQFSRTQ